MQATLPPIWSDIERYRRRRGRITLAELTEITARAHQLHLQSQLYHLTPQEMRRLSELRARLDWPRAHRPEILLYTPAQLRQLIRLGDHPLSVPSHPSPGTPSWRPGPLGAPWHVPDSSPTSETRAGGEWGWRGVRGWGAGALLLVAALLLVRATDRCFTKGYARSRRRRSEEWSTPNVLATSNQSPSIELDLSPEAASPPDPPPPYTARDHEDPPPPYCHVAFNNKHDAPTVQIYNITEQAHSSNGFNNGHTIEEHKIQDIDRSNSLESVELAPLASRETTMDIQNGQTRNAVEEHDEIGHIDRNNSLESVEVDVAPLASRETSIDMQNEETQIASQNERPC